MDFRGFDSNINLEFTGWNSQAQRKSSVKFDSSNVSRRNVSRRIGRSVMISSSGII